MTGKIKRLGIFLTIIVLLLLLPLNAMALSDIDLPGGTIPASIILSGKAVPNAMVSIKITDSANTIVYFNGMKAAADGNYSFDVDLRGCTLPLDVTVTYQDKVNTAKIKSVGGGGPVNPDPSVPVDPAPGDTPSSVIIVDGKEVDAGTVETNGDHTTVKVNQETFKDQLETAGDNVTIVIPAGTGSAEAQLVLQNIDDMAQKNMTLSIQTGGIEYGLPASSLDISTVTQSLGAENSSDIVISVAITSNVNEETQAIIDGAMEEYGTELVFPPMQFTVTASYDGQTVEIDTFNQYVTRCVEITAEQAEKVTTAIVIDPDGTVRHVPTRVYEENGKWYAEISSLTNSSYALVNNEKNFTDTKGKWYESAVKEMAGRMIVNGVSDSLFAGERDITRSEFASILIRALGLPEKDNASVFHDVDDSQWYAKAVNTAYGYGLVTGVGNNMFSPDRNITRQEAMVMIQRAANISKLTVEQGDISAFSDAGSVSDWAIDAVRFNVGCGLIVGSEGRLMPLENINRAETATVVLRLLQKSGLIDVRG